MKAEDLLDTLRGDGPAGADRSDEIQPASLRCSDSSTSISRRADSDITSHVSAAPMTRPTMSSHQLNSAFKGRPPRRDDGRGSCAGQV